MSLRDEDDARACRVCVYCNTSSARAATRGARAMQQVAARNCLHGAASGARAGVSVLEELFWNAAARSDAIAASLAAAACICMQIARVLSRARDGLGYVVSGTRRDAAVRTGNVQIDIGSGSKSSY